MLSFVRKTKIKGFTLAEVLITLGILGIIAEMTIPAIINGTNKVEYVSALRRSYSMLSQAHQMIASDSGDFESALSESTNSDDFANVFAQKMKVAKNCGKLLNAVDSDCFTNHWYLLSGGGDPGYDRSVYLNAFALSTNYNAFVTVDGIAYLFVLGDPTCANADGLCGGIMVDVNGPAKGPSTVGRDLFMW